MAPRSCLPGRSQEPAQAQQETGASHGPTALGSSKTEKLMSSQPSQQPSFRVRPIMVSAGVYDAAKALAEVQGLSCPDEWADVTLGKLLQAEHHLDELIKRRRKSREADTQWYQELLAGKEEQLP
jgi:hypothetical protein